MFSSLLDSIMPSFTSLNKKNLIKSKDFLYRTLESEIIPSMDLFITSNVKSLKKNKFLSNAFSLMKIKSSNVLDGVKVLRELFQDILDSKSKIDKLIDETNLLLLDKTTSIKDATVVKLIEDFTFMSLYVLDFLYYSVIDDEDTIYSKKKLDSIKKELPLFIILVSYYNGNIKNVIDEVNHLPETSVTVATKESASMIDTVLSKVKKLSTLPSINGFVGNPIYHIRMWLVDREIKKYETLKDRKGALEARLLELRYQEAGSNDPSLKERIEYFEEKVSQIECELAKIENS